MKRVFYQTKLYDYTSAAEAVKHISHMESKGWSVKKQSNGEYIYNNGQDDFKFSVEFFKEA